MRFNLLSALTIFLLSTPTLAGPGLSGGARGVVCRDSKGAVKSAELLDLWEARVIYGRKVLSSKLPLSAQVESALEKLQFSVEMSGFSNGSKDFTPNEYLLLLLKGTADLFLKNSPDVHRLRHIKLQTTPDSDEPVVPNQSGCRVEQLVNYFDAKITPLILVDQDLVDHLSSTDQAALIAHEAFYAFLRTGLVAEDNSVRVRRSIGYIFAGNTFPSKDLLLGKDYVRCETTGSTNPSEIYFYEDAEKRVKPLVTYSFGQIAIGQFDAYFPMGQSLEFFTSDELCHPAEPAKPTNLYWTLTGAGPVDFTRTNIMMGTCEDGHAKFYFSKNGTFDSQDPTQAQSMSCQRETN